VCFFSRIKLNGCSYYVIFEIESANWRKRKNLKMGKKNITDVEQYIDKQTYKKTRDSLTALIVVSVLLFVVIIIIVCVWTITPINALNATNPQYKNGGTMSIAKRFELLDGIYTIESANDHTYMGVCKGCYDAPAECTSSAIGFVTSPTNFVVSSKGIYKSIQDAETKKYIYSSKLNQICLKDACIDNEAKWAVEIFQSINEKAAIAIFKNFGNQNYIRECSGACPSSTGSYKLPIVDADRKTAISGGLGIFIIRRQ
jgi:hypothetical protein